MDSEMQHLLNEIMVFGERVQGCIISQDPCMLHHHLPLLVRYMNLLMNLVNASEGRCRATVLSVFEELLQLQETAESMVNDSGVVDAGGIIVHTESSGRRGRPRLMISHDTIPCLNDTGLSWAKMARTLNISLFTLKNLRKEYSIPKKTYSLISDELLDQQIINIKFEHPAAGYVYVWSSLKAIGIRVTWSRLKERMRLIDPVGIFSRSRKRLNRRKYKVKGANYLWHMDGNEKLVSRRFYIHGCVDGFSRRVKYLSLCHDKRADTVLKSFLKAVDVRGVPIRVRGDRGTENNGVKHFMQEVRSTVSNPYLVGRSVHNTRVERIWCEVNRVVSKKFKEIFLSLKESGFLNENSVADLLCLSFVYYPRINRSLQNFVECWNNHDLSTEGSASPNQLWTASILQQIQSNSNQMNLQLVDGHLEILGPEFSSDEHEMYDPRFSYENILSLCSGDVEASDHFIHMALQVVPDTLLDDGQDGIFLYLNLREEMLRDFTYDSD